jgi:predicted dehydrogenase
MSGFGWAIVGPGRIAHRFAEAIHGTPGTYLAHVQGRDHDRANTFAQTWIRDGISSIRVSETLDAVLADANVRAVYIATPHAFHADAVRQCLNAGKPVLCEKPLVTDAKTAAELITLSRTKNVFLMEAVWTRFLPIYAQADEWLKHRAIGAVRGMQSSFCFNTPWDPNARTFDAAQAGGALLDIGIYNLTVTRWAMAAAFGVCPEARDIQSTAVIGPTGVDHRLSANVIFSNGVTSQFVCGFDSDAENAFHIYGEHGTITIHAKFWQAASATLTRAGAEPQTVHRPWRVNGFEGELEEAMRCIEAGKIESDVMPHEETRQTLVWMDLIREQIGVHYPFE